MLKVLFASRSGNAEKFTEWVEDVIHTHHIGTDNVKIELFTNGLKNIGIDTKTIKKVFNTTSCKTTPVIYLFLIGNANYILKNNTYDDNFLVCKFGKTQDLVKRTSDHTNNFKKIFNVDIDLLIFSIIDKEFLFKAETLISKYFENDKIKLDNDKSIILEATGINSKELIIINKNDIKTIKDQYALIQTSYIGSYAELKRENDELKIEIKDEKNKNLIKDKDIEILTMKFSNENKLLTKDIELQNYKIKLLENNIKI